MQATRQTPSFEKWIPDPESGDATFTECAICYEPLSMNPDPIKTNLVPEVFGHRQDNTVFHKVHLYCLEQWITTKSSSLSINNTVSCPGGCGALINCDVVHPPDNSLVDLSKQLSRLHLSICLGFSIITFAGLMYIAYSSNKSLCGRAAVFLTVGGLTVKKEVNIWNRNKSLLINPSRNQFTLKKDLWNSATYTAIRNGLLNSIALVCCAIMMEIFKVDSQNG